VPSPARVNLQPAEHPLLCINSFQKCFLQPLVFWDPQAQGGMGVKPAPKPSWPGVGMGAKFYPDWCRHLDFH